jgi:hypothetical protein
MGGKEGVKVAEAEAGAVMRRADGPQKQRVGRIRVRAEDLVPVHLGTAIEADKSLAHRPLRRQRIIERVNAVHVEHSGDDLAIARAAAQHAAEGVHDLQLAGGRVAIEQCRRGDNHARRADAALRRAMTQERVLQPRGMGRGFVQTLDCHDGTSLDLPGQDKAATDRFAVEQNGAGATVASVAADLHARGAERVAQDLCQARRRIDLRRYLPPVEGKGDAGGQNVKHGRSPAGTIQGRGGRG